MKITLILAFVTLLAAAPTGGKDKIVATPPQGKARRNVFLQSPGRSTSERESSASASANTERTSSPETSDVQEKDKGKARAKRPIDEDYDTAEYNAPQEEEEDDAEMMRQTLEKSRRDAGPPKIGSSSTTTNSDASSVNRMSESRKGAIKRKTCDLCREKKQRCVPSTKAVVPMMENGPECGTCGSSEGRICGGSYLHNRKRGPTKKPEENRNSGKKQSREEEESSDDEVMMTIEELHEWNAYLVAHRPVKIARSEKKLYEQFLNSEK